MRDRIEVGESREAMWNGDADQVRVTVVLVSLGPDDVEWFNEHAPGWQEHLSSRQVQAQCMISGLDMVMAKDPKEIVRQTRRAIVRKLAQEIAINMEPVLSRYTHDGRWEQMS